MLSIHYINNFIRRKLFSLGSSKSLPDILQIITGHRNVSARSYVKYNEPLMRTLLSYNKQRKVQPGWTDECPNVYSTASVTSATPMTLITMTLAAFVAMFTRVSDM